MSKGIDELRRLHRTLGVLLDDPQPGLLTWKKMLSEILLEMACYAGVGMAPKHAPAMLDALVFIQEALANFRDGLDATLHPVHGLLKLEEVKYCVVDPVVDAATAPPSAPASAGTTTSG